MWRLAYGADEGRVKMVLMNSEKFAWPQIAEQVSEVSRDYILIKEELWQEYLLLEDKEIAETFNNWYNPHEARPEFIRKKRKAQK